MKRIGILFGLCLLLTTWPVMAEEVKKSTAETETVSESDDIKNRKLTEEELAIAKHVIENFLKMEEVPRPSGHEEKISAFFMDWAKEQGFDPVQDDVLNVVFDVPATEGYENYPMVGLQAHMDMVCVGDSPNYDPENDPIKVIVDYDTATMTADGTSLGADDGIGCAIIMSMAQGLAPHGPLRVIITVDEEDGMTGIMNLDPATVADLSYLINVDSEVSDAVTVSTAGGVQIDVTDEVPTKIPDGDCAMELTVSGAKGGHSGMDINKGRINAIDAMEGILKELSARDISYEIASFEGGTASNAIPAEAKALITVRAEDQDNVTQAVADMEAFLKEDYKDTEENLSVGAGVVNAVVDVVVTPEEQLKVFAFMDCIVNGVYSMSEDIEGLVESSSNLGVLTLTPERFLASCYERSSSAEKTDEILAIDRKAVDANGMEVTMEPSGDPWPYNPDSVLLPLTQKVYLEQNGEEITVETLHATLECGTFAVMNPSLDMVSIGPDLIDVHSTGEMIYLRTIPKTFNLLAGILKGIGAASYSDAQELSTIEEATDEVTEETIDEVTEEAADETVSVTDQAQALLDAEDYDAAIPLLQEAADQGDPVAQNGLGNCYFNGWGVEQDYEEALKWYHLAADQGYVNSLTNIGQSYAFGIGVDQDYKEAVKYFQLAADQGFSVAQYYLGLCYVNGAGIDKNYEKAVKFFQLAADQGYAEAQNELGVCYDNGFGVDQDYEKAVKYYQLAADQGLAIAQYNLGCMYNNGFGVEQDYQKAMELYQLAADKGYTNALSNIGWLYYKGLGVDQDYDEAVKYFKMGADEGDEYAIFNLGMCYQDGTGVEKDLEKAAELYQKALDAGYKPAEEEKPRVEEVLGNMALANPWVDMTAKELSDASGLSFGVPEGAENVIYRYMESDHLAEMQFTVDHDEFCARIQPADEPMNISGMYFEWENEEDVKIGSCAGTIGQAQTGSEDYVELCQWYDADQGLQYSLSVYTTDVDGLDLAVVAEQVYKK